MAVIIFLLELIGLVIGLALALALLHLWTNGNQRARVIVFCTLIPVFTFVSWVFISFNTVVPLGGLASVVPSLLLGAAIAWVISGSSQGMQRLNANANARLAVRQAALLRTPLPSHPYAARYLANRIAAFLVLSVVFGSVGFFVCSGMVLPGQPDYGGFGLVLGAGLAWWASGYQQRQVREAKRQALKAAKPQQLMG